MYTTSCARWRLFRNGATTFICQFDDWYLLLTYRQNRTILSHASKIRPDLLNNALNSATPSTLIRGTTLKCRHWSVISIWSATDHTRFRFCTRLPPSPSLPGAHWLEFWAIELVERRQWYCLPLLVSFSRLRCHLLQRGGSMVFWSFSSSRVTNLAMLQQPFTRWNCLGRLKGAVSNTRISVVGRWQCRSMLHICSDQQRELNLIGDWQWMIGLLLTGLGWGSEKVWWLRIQWFRWKGRLQWELG